jgi:hypothetical protein
VVSPALKCCSTWLQWDGGFQRNVSQATTRACATEPGKRCRLGRKASRRFEPRSLDSESRVLTVTPRGPLLSEGVACFLGNCLQQGAWHELGHPPQSKHHGARDRCATRRQEGRRGASPHEPPADRTPQTSFFARALCLSDFWRALQKHRRRHCPRLGSGGGSHGGSRTAALGIMAGRYSFMVHRAPGRVLCGLLPLLHGLCGGALSCTWHPHAG